MLQMYRLFSKSANTGRFWSKRELSSFFHSVRSHICIHSKVLKLLCIRNILFQVFNVDNSSVRLGASFGRNFMFEGMYILKK